MPSARQDRRTIGIVDFDAARTDEIVRLWRESFEFGVGIVDPHPIEEQRKAFVTTVLPNNAVRMALLDDRLVAFIAATNESISHLYVRVGHHRCGVGSHLLDWAKTQSNGKLWLSLLHATQSLARSTRSTDSRSSLAVSSRIGDWPTSNTNGPHAPPCYDASICPTPRLTENHMPTYLFANVEVTDVAGYEQYRQQVSATIEAFGGRYLVRGGTTEILEGDWTPKRLVILEFPDMTRLKAWYQSPAYRPLIELRQRTTESMLVAVEGVPSQ